jgi:hypothetical protein
MVMDRFPCSLAEAGNRYGQASMRFAIIEIRMYAFNKRPMVGGELHWFQYF